MNPCPARLLLSLCACLLAGCTVAPVQETARSDASTDIGPLERFADEVIDDYRGAYGSQGLVELLPPIAVHGLLANTSADGRIRDKWQDHWRSETGDDLFHKFILVGDYAQNRWSVPLYGIGMLAGDYRGTGDDSWVATWASRSLRANLLAGPQGWALTYALGTHRPTDGHSGWNPWNDNDGVSGHSLYGAVPFLTAAHMAEDPLLRGSLYVVSSLPALARINANKHYASQAWLGWALAYTATSRIAGDHDDPDGMSWLVLPLPDGAVASITWRF